MAEPTISSLNNAILNLRTQLLGIEARVEVIETESDLYITYADLRSANLDLVETMTTFSDAMSVVETKLQKIVLEDDTRLYLQESEITDFRNHFRQLRAFMSDMERTRQAFIRLAARYNLTNSSL